MFYKNFMETIPLWVYGWLSLFSGTFIYNAILYACYNVVFTAFPIIWFAVYDWEYNKVTLLKSPRLYYIGLENVYFNSYTFWRWIFYAIWQAALILTLSYYIYNEPNDVGKLNCMVSTGAFVFGSIVIVVNYKLFIASSQHSWIFTFIIVASVASYFGVFLILNSIPIYNDFGTFEMLFSEPISYFALVFFTFSYVLIDAGAKFANNQINTWYLDRKERITKN